MQTNWRNGAKQLKFDDPGKYWKSSDVDTSILEELTLSKELTSAGQLASGVKVNCIESWKADATTYPFGDGSDSTLSISTDTTDAPIDSACTGTAGAYTLSATNASFAAGQRVLIHQTFNSNTGNYEHRTIASYTAGTITLTEPLTNSYVSGAQVLVMKEYTTVTIASAKTLTAKAWNGTVGGIIAMYANTSITVTGNISATSKGFRSGNFGGDNAYSQCGESSNGAPVATYANNGAGGGGTYREFANGNVDSAGGGGHAAAGTAGSEGASAPGIAGQAGTAVGVASLSTAFLGGAGGSGGHQSIAAGNGGAGGGFIYLIAKEITVTGTIVANGGAGGNASSGTGTGAGGGGAGGSILLKGQTVTLGTALVTATGGAGGSAAGAGLPAGGAGSVGRIHVSYSSTLSGTTSPNVDSSQDSSLVDVPASTETTAYAGTSEGKIYTWDNATTWTEVFDTRALTWYQDTTLKDVDKVVGDTGGTETAQSQGFQLAVGATIKGIAVYLKKGAGTPGNITVTIETDSTNTPSGSLANAAATGTITAFTTDTYGWVNCEFTTAFTLSATTLYHIVLKTAAADNDNYYHWGADESSPSYTSGAMSASTNGGSTWSAVAGTDALFKVLGNATSANCMLITKVGGTKKLYIGTGDPEGTVNTDARLYAYDGSSFSLVKTFVTATESVINSMAEYGANSTVYIGVGPQAKIYSTTDFSSFAVSKDIDIPQNPGYTYAMKEYNRVLYVGGGSPEQVPTQYYQGFVNYYDTTIWNTLYPFDFTVIKSLEFYDAYLFMGTYHGHLYVFDTSSLNPLFNFKDQYNYLVQIMAMKYFDDKLYMGLYPQDSSSEDDVGIWKFDRRGLSLAHTVSGVTGYRCFAIINGSLLVGTGDDGYVYKLAATYKTQGWYQSSYFDANLPSIPKLYNSVTIRHDPLESGQSIVVYYKFKESDDWTTLGTSDTADETEDTFYFSSGTTSKKISLKCELNTTDTTATPKLTEVIMQYALYPIRKWQWTMKLKATKNLRLLDGSYETRTAEQIREDLESLPNTEQLYNFVDVDGTYYNVLVHDVDMDSWVINSEDVNEEEVVITLLQQ